MNLDRYCNLNRVKEVSELQSGLDFRKPEFRRAVFLRFYDFHVRYRSHPGCVYYLFPYLNKRLNLDDEQKLWLAFINGNTQNPVMTYVIMKEFPYLEEVNEEKLKDWFNSSWKQLDFDIDRRRQKKLFPEAVIKYRKTVQENGGTQQAMFDSIIESKKEGSPFSKVWDFIIENFTGFGRLSTFSYSEYLRIQGLKIDCDNLFLEDFNGSMSHRNGILKVLGRDDLECWKNNPLFNRKYTKEEIEWLKNEAKALLEDARKFSSIKGNPYLDEMNYFTMESTLCTYKGWHRPNRRYANVYNDMLYNRIKKGESLWQGKDFSIFWDARKACLPEYLRLEDNPSDPGLSKPKQNHYRLTGQVIMMENEYPEFQNDYSWKKMEEQK